MRKERFTNSWPLFFVLMFFFGGQVAFPQLNNFTLSVTKTDESCTANGTLNFNVSNITPGATVVYQVYRLPDLVNAIVETNATVFTGLTAGSYQVVATQFLGNLSSSQQQTVSIQNTIVPLQYNVASTPVVCNSVGTMTVNVTSGNPVSYEIIAGSVIVPPQSSNVFANMPIGEYDIRVIDNCGDGVVKTFRILEAPSTIYLSIAPAQEECDLLSCTTRLVEFRANPPEGYTMSYPLNAELTVFPPDGSAPFALNQVIASGGVTFCYFSFEIPFYDVEVFLVNVRITDQCGSAVQQEDIPITSIRRHFIDGQNPRSCLNELNIGACGYLPPYTVEFLSTPTGFDPLIYNAQHPGPMNFMGYHSTPEHQMPEGEYVVRVTDFCGSFFEEELTVKKSVTKAEMGSGYIGCDFVSTVVIGPGVLPQTVFITEAPQAFGHDLPYDVSFNIRENGFFEMGFTVPGTYVFQGTNLCGDFYSIEIIIPASSLKLLLDYQLDYRGCLNDRNSISFTLFDPGADDQQLLTAPDLSSVFITQAPPNFLHDLPYDVSSSIDEDDQFTGTIPGIVPGDYMVVATDVCGVPHPQIINVPLVPPSPPDPKILSGCDPGMGSVAFSGSGINLVSVIMQSAPTTYSHSMPYDVSFNIDFNGGFSMNTLPEGDYTFYLKDECGNEYTTTAFIVGLATEANIFELHGNCGSFDVLLYNLTNTSNIQRNFWLQKYNPSTQQWVHPYTNLVYAPGTVPNANNSLLIQNYSTNFNIAALGKFRIVRSHLIYPNAASYTFNYCVTVIREFEYTGELKLIDARTIPCSNDSYNVSVEAIGVAPLTYYITSRNGQDFFIDNGSSNTFANLQSGIYNFQVRDNCGNIVNRVYDITTLAEPEITSSVLCEGRNGFLSVVAFSFFNYQWWKADNPTQILSTTNSLSFSPFSGTLTPGTYFVRIYSNSGLTCLERVLSFVVNPPVLPNAGGNGQRHFCGTVENLDLFSLLAAPYDSGGSWIQTSPGGALNDNVWSSAGLSTGNYSFNYMVHDLCDNYDVATVELHLSEIPPNPIVQVNPGFCNLDPISFTVDTIENATYSWTGPGGFTSEEQNPTLESNTVANSGTYTVTATLVGCQSATSVNVNLLPSPDFGIETSCLNGQYTLTVKPRNGSFDPQTASYSWTGPEQFVQYQNPIQITDLPTGVYQVTVTNTDSCSASQSIDVTGTKCTITNYISANNDSSNDNLNLSGLNVKRIEIYSRWGRLVYDRNNYIDQWHGQNNNGSQLPDSTYYYIAYLASGEEKQGWVFVTH